MKKRHGNKIVFSLICCIIPFCLVASKALEANYESDSRMFHIERSVNKNIVCYDFNLNAQGVLNSKNPIHVYWINREEHPGQRGELKYFQQPAYGYKVVNISDDKVLIKLNAVKTRLTTIEKNGQQYICRTSINGQPAILQRIYVKTRETNSLQVEYIEVSGILAGTGAVVTERIKP